MGCARAGMFNCPHTGVALACLLKFIQRGEIQKNSRVVVISTAHGLKFGEAKAAYHTGPPGVRGRYANPPVELAADRQAVYDAVMRHMEKSAG